MNLSKDKLEKYLKVLEKLKPLFNQYLDQSMAQVSLRFCISHPACTLAIPGAKTSAQVIDNCKASDLGNLSEKDIKELL